MVTLQFEMNYLMYTLEIENKIEESALSDDEKKRMPLKLYELIPRKCYVDIPGKDHNIQHKTNITIQIDSERVINIPIYSIKDVEDGNKVNNIN